MDRDQGRFITVTLDYRTGTHQIWNWPTANRSKCVAICQGMGPVDPQKHRLILKAHDDDPKDDV